MDFQDIQVLTSVKDKFKMSGIYEYQDK